MASAMPDEKVQDIGILCLVIFESCFTSSGSATGMTQWGRFTRQSENAPNLSQEFMQYEKFGASLDTVA